VTLVSEFGHVTLIASDPEFSATGSQGKLSERFYTPDFPLPEVCDMRMLVIGMCMLAALGCGSAISGTAPNDVPTKGTEKSATDVTVKILSLDDFHSLVAGHKGKVVVVDCWSTSCPTCMEKFPSFVELHKKYKDQVACVSLSLDNQGLDKIETVVEQKVKPFLNEKKATFDNVVTKEEDTEVFKKLDIPSIPAVLVYGRDGKLVKKYAEGEFSYQEVEGTVKELLATKS
jgi:thiol-disulfide isomerase/thioredoxin